MPEQYGDKTQDPTPHRRQQAREQGQVARSQDLGSALVLVAGVVVLLVLGGDVVRLMNRLADRYLGADAWLSVDAAQVQAHLLGLLGELAVVLLPILGLMLLCAVASNLAQVGLLFLPDKVVPDITRLDPIQGFFRLFSLTNFVRLGFGLFKLAVVSVVAYLCVLRERDTLVTLANLGLAELGAYLIDVMFWTTFKIAGALLTLSLLDYFFQWWKNEQDLRMTTQEVREELKNLQGDPQIIARRRQVQRQLVVNRLKTAVPKAHVVITNPTELAIAIQYDHDTMNAPVVVAKGAGVLAQRIRQLALEHGIPIVEKKPLAQALYRDVDVGRPIPSQLYSAVAEVLAYVYQLQGKAAPQPRAA